MVIEPLQRLSQYNTDDNHKDDSLEDGCVFEKILVEVKWRRNTVCLQLIVDGDGDQGGVTLRQVPRFPAGSQERQSRDKRTVGRFTHIKAIERGSFVDFYSSGQPADSDENTIVTENKLLVRSGSLSYRGLLSRHR